jgi:hypothetical protein
LKKLAFLAIVCALLVLSNLASAQQADAMFGFGTITSPGASQCGTTGNGNCPEKGGVYPSVGFDVIFHKRFGLGFDTSWRGGQGTYSTFGIPYRPILLDFNAVYQPRINKKTGLDLMGGIGWQDTRFYSGNYTCGFYSCTNYVSSNHFLVDVGGGIRYYVWGHVFVRPEAHYYWIHNNIADFTSGNIIRVGASIGYTIGGPE